MRWPAAKLRIIVKSGSGADKLLQRAEKPTLWGRVDDGYPSITIISLDDSILLTCPKTPELGNSPLKFSNIQFIGWIGCLIKNHS